MACKHSGENSLRVTERRCSQMSLMSRREARNRPVRPRRTTCTEHGSGDPIPDPIKCGTYRSCPEGCAQKRAKSRYGGHPTLEFKGHKSLPNSLGTDFCGSGDDPSDEYKKNSHPQRATEPG